MQNRKEQASAEMTSSRKLIRDCWVRCDDPRCRKWRLISPECLPALRDMAQVEPGRTCWRSWLDDAPLRYEVGLKAHRAQGLALNPENELLAGEVAGEANVDLISSSVGSVDVGGDVDECGDVDAVSDSATESVRSSVQGSLDGSGDDWGSVLRSLGGVGGGLGPADLEDQREAAAAELARCSYAVGRVTSTRVLFRCDMLMCKRKAEEDGDGLWRFMSCEDPCDFLSIRDADWGRSCVWMHGDPIVLWPSDVSSPPSVADASEQQLQRFGVVLKTVLAGEDVDMLSSAHHLSSAASRTGSHGVKDSKVIIRVEADPLLGLEQIQEVHYKFNVGTPAVDVVDRPQQQYGRATRSQLNMCRDHVDKGKLPARASLVPVKLLQPRVAKYDVVLKEGPLRAVHAKHVMLTRMVLFSCNECVERFPAFHPAYDPRDVPKLDVELLRRGKDGVAACNTEVARWDEFPPFEPSEAELVLAEQYSGMCRRCHVDLVHQRKQLGEQADEADVIAKFSWRSHMDPCFMFPEQELRELFNKASLTEHMFIALEHMQVSFVTAQKTRLTKFRKNVISFPQDLPSFVQRVGVMCRYDVGDRVNSLRGPGRDLARQPRLFVDASEEDRLRFAPDDFGRVVFPATVIRVHADGVLELQYDFGIGDGLEEITQVQPRVRMPWHPKFLRGQYTLMLRRNLGHGRVLEGLELRWGLVSNILHALTRMGHWRLSGVEGPMHKYYDPRLFDLMSEQDIFAERAVASDGSSLPSAATGEALALSGVDVRFFGADSQDGQDSGGVDAGVDEATFRRWLEASCFRLGSAIARWWVRLPVEDPEENDAIRKDEPEETAVDLFRKVSDRFDGFVTSSSLTLYFKGVGALELPNAEDDEHALQELVDMVYEELTTAAHFEKDRTSGGMM